MGDVILASAYLESLPGDGTVDWVVSREYAGILQGHPRIGKVWAFDRSSGLSGWRALCRELSGFGYTEIVDLHGSLRTHLARWLMRGDASHPSPAVWRTATFPRWRILGYFVFKAAWPKAWRPVPRWRVFAEMVNSRAGAQPNLKHLVNARPDTPILDLPYLCVMPSSRWRGKEWPLAHWVTLLERARSVGILILGQMGDQASHALYDALSAKGLSVVNGIGRFDWISTAQCLARAKACIAVDTGIGHLAEAVGTPTFMLFGPTISTQGFGPWRSESRALEQDLICRPCSRDGRRCYRPVNKYLCMTSLTAESVARLLPHDIAGLLGWV